MSPRPVTPGPPRAAGARPAGAGPAVTVSLPPVAAARAGPPRLRRPGVTLLAAAAALAHPFKLWPRPIYGASHCSSGKSESRSSHCQWR